MEDQLKETIKERSDVVEVINSYIPLKKAGTNYKALCPFHNEKSPSFSVNAVKQIYYCFGCHKGGDVFQFVMDYESVDFLGALKILAHRASITIPKPRSSTQPYEASKSGEVKQSKDTLYDVHEKLSLWYHKNLFSKEGRVGLNYIQERGIDDDILIKFNVGFAPDSWDQTSQWGQKHGYDRELMIHGGILISSEKEDGKKRVYDRFRNRLIFPIWDETGRVIGFSGRVLDSSASGGKYINSPETAIFSKGKILYALHLARQEIRKSKSVLLCEGQMDVIACHQAGFANAVAPMGTAFTESQARLLKRHTDTIIFLFDADSAGQKAIKNSLRVFLPAGLTAKVAIMDEGEDPDSVVRSAGVERLREIVENAEDFFTFRIEMEIVAHNSDTPEGKGKITAAVLEDIALIENLVARGEYCRILANRLCVPERAITDELQRMLRKQMRRNAVKDRFSRTLELPKSGARSDKSVGTKADIILLELAIHHKEFADRLVTDLPHEFVNDTPVGRALNEVLAHTEHGEWGEVSTILTGKLNDYSSKDVNKALFDPEYGKETKQDRLEKAYLDSLYKGVVIPKLKEELGQLQQKLKQVSEKEGITRLRQENFALRRTILEHEKQWRRGIQ